MTTIASPSLPDRFNDLIDGVQKDIAASVVWGCLAIPLIRLIWRRLRTMRARFASVLARLRAGEPPRPVPVRIRAARVRPAAAPPVVPSLRNGWVIHAVSWFVMIRHYELEEMLEDPEMATLVTDAPELGRVLRPLCQMLAVKLPDMLRLPRRPRRRIEKFPPAPDWLVNEPGAELRPDGSVWMRLGASTIWRPGCGQTLAEAQKFDRPRRIWPR
jgi:hypothetical protein